METTKITCLAARREKRILFSLLSTELPWRGFSREFIMRVRARKNALETRKVDVVSVRASKRAKNEGGTDGNFTLASSSQNT